MYPADWTMVGTTLELERKIGNKFKVRPGWIETDSDTVFCEPLTDGRFWVHVWNSTGVRQRYAKALGMPVYGR